MPYLLFLKNRQIFNCLLLQIIGGALRVNSLPTSVVCWSPQQTVWTQIRPDILSGLIWIQTVWHSDGVPERIFRRSWFWKKSSDDKKKNTCKITQYAKNAHKYLFSILCYWTVNNIILAVFYCHPGGFQTTFLWKNKNIIRLGITKRNVYNTVYHHRKYLTSESKVKIPCMASCEFLPLFMVYNLFLDNQCM